jgi:hypothetical protein
MKMDLVKLKEIIDQNFTEPFLPKGVVQTRLTGGMISNDGRDLELTIQIGQREITFDENLDVLDAGTSFLMTIEMKEIPQDDRPTLDDILEQLPPEMKQNMKVIPLKDILPPEEDQC